MGGLALLIPVATFVLLTNETIQKQWAVWSLTRVVDRGYDMYEMVQSGQHAFMPYRRARQFVRSEHAESEASRALATRLRGTTPAVQYRALIGLQVMGSDARSVLPELLQLYQDATLDSNTRMSVCETIFCIDRQVAEECGAANTYRESFRSLGLIPPIPDPTSKIPTLRGVTP